MLPLIKIAKKLRSWLKSQHLGRESITDRYAIMEASLIGVFSALAALLLKEGVGWLGSYRLQLVSEGGAFTVLPLFGLVLGALAGFLVEYLSPSAKGGGIPQVKAALARFKISLTLKVAVVKIVSTILVLGGGITLGRRGPTVHIGAALAGELTRWFPTSPEHRQRMIAAGAAAGLAAGFNTPIAGVLFVVEELMRDVSNLTLETAIVASFTGSVVSLILQSNDPNLASNLLKFDNLTFSPSEIPFYIILGIIAGILGALFNRSVLLSFQVYQKFKLPLGIRIGIAGLLSGLIVASLPPLFLNQASLKDFLVRGELSWQQTALTLVAQYILTIIGAGSSAPGGLFAPALTMGSALGYLMGDLEQFLTVTDSSSVFALAGMGALFTGIVRVPVTAIVIVFELNANFNLVLPLMISCAVAYISAETLHKGSLYQHLLRNMGMELKEDSSTYTSNHNLLELQAEQLMQSSVETVDVESTMADLLKLMSLSLHRGFPVIENGRLVGIVTQSDLDKVEDANPQTAIREIMTTNPISVSASANLSNVLYLLNRYRLSRLPVLDGNKLVGIITRTDIIRAEVKELQVDPSITPQVSYTVYQTRSPATGRGLLLVPIAPDDDYHRLFTIASMIAKYYQYELEFIHVIKVELHKEPRNTTVNLTKTRRVMSHLERMGRKANISLHTSIIVAHHRSGVILELIKEKHVDMMLMGWQNTKKSSEFIFSHLIDNLINKATCELILVKLGDEFCYPPTKQLKIPRSLGGTCLIPMAGGPNALEGLALLPALLQVYNDQQLPDIYLTRVYNPSQHQTDHNELDLAVSKLKSKVDTDVHPLYIRSDSVVDAISQTARKKSCDLLILGASRTSLLSQAFHGNIPLEITSKSNTTVILIRLPN